LGDTVFGDTDAFIDAPSSQVARDLGTEVLQIR
jgi:hypothetical protein